MEALALSHELMPGRRLRSAASKATATSTGKAISAGLRRVSKRQPLVAVMLLHP